MSTDVFYSFLRSLKLEKYYSIFRDNKIEFNELLDSKEEEIIETLKGDGKISENIVKDSNLIFKRMKAYFIRNDPRIFLKKILWSSRCEKFLPNFISMGITDKNLSTLTNEKPNSEKMKKLTRNPIKAKSFLKSLKYYLFSNDKYGAISKKKVFSLVEKKISEEEKKSLKRFIMSRHSSGMNDKEEKIFDQTFSVVEEWIRHDKMKVMLILGNAGSGKSLFARYVQRKFLNKIRQDKKTRIPLFIRLASVENPTKLLLNKYLKEQLDLGDREVRYVKNHFELLLILDGFDEVGANYHRNLYRLNNFGSLKNVKVIITCRSSSLMQICGRRKYMELFAPIGENGYEFNKIQQIVIRPFSPKNILDYISNYVVEKKSEWSARKYMKFIEKQELFTILSNPFLLYVGIGSLLKLFKRGTKVTKYLLMDIFIHKWLTRQKASKLDGILNKSKITVAKMRSFCESIAFLMLKMNTNTFFFSPEVFEGEVLGIIDSESEEKKWINFFVEMKKEHGKDITAILLTCCPVNEIAPMTYQFLHKSIWEFLIASVLIKDIRNCDDLDVLPNAIENLNTRLLNMEMSIVYFMKDIVCSSSTLQRNLVSIIENSRGNRVVSISSANAATILNYSHFIFRKLTLNDVIIDQADMNGCVLCNCDFSFSSMEFVDFRNAHIVDCIFWGCKMKGVFLGEPLSIMKCNSNCKISPCARYLASIDRNDNAMIVQSLQSKKTLFRDELSKNVSLKWHKSKMHQFFLVASSSSNGVDNFVKIYLSENGKKFIFHKVTVNEKGSRRSTYFPPYLNRDIVIFKHDNVRGESVFDIFTYIIGKYSKDEKEKKTLVKWKLQKLFSFNSGESKYQNGLKKIYMDGFFLKWCSQKRLKMFYYDNSLVPIALIKSKKYGSLYNDFIGEHGKHVFSYHSKKAKRIFNVGSFSNEFLRAVAFINEDDEFTIFGMKITKMTNKKIAFKVKSRKRIWMKSGIHMYHYDKEGLVIMCILDDRRSVMLWSEKNQQCVYLNEQFKSSFCIALDLSWHEKKYMVAISKRYEDDRLLIVKCFKDFSCILLRKPCNCKMKWIENDLYYEKEGELKCYKENIIHMGEILNNKDYFVEKGYVPSLRDLMNNYSKVLINAYYDKMVVFWKNWDGFITKKWEFLVRYQGSYPLQENLLNFQGCLYKYEPGQCNSLFFRDNENRGVNELAFDYENQKVERIFHTFDERNEFKTFHSVSQKGKYLIGENHFYDLKRKKKFPSSCLGIKEKMGVYSLSNGRCPIFRFIFNEQYLAVEMRNEEGDVKGKELIKIKFFSIDYLIRYQLGFFVGQIKGNFVVINMIWNDNCNVLFVLCKDGFARLYRLSIKKETRLFFIEIATVDVKEMGKMKVISPLHSPFRDIPVWLTGDDQKEKVLNGFVLKFGNNKMKIFKKNKQKKGKVKCLFINVMDDREYVNDLIRYKDNLYFYHQNYLWKIRCNFNDFLEEKIFICMFQPKLICNRTNFDSSEMTIDNANSFIQYGAIKNFKYTEVNTNEIEDKNTSTSYNYIKGRYLNKFGPFKTKFALVIGNADYTKDSLFSLKNPINDALSMERTLKKLNFEVSCIFNADSDSMKKELQYFVDNLQENIDPSFKEDITIVIYFSGHGCIIDTISDEVFIPIDCPLSLFEVNDENNNCKEFLKRKEKNEERILEVCLSMKNLLCDLEMVPGGNRIIFYDACRNIIGVKLIEQKFINVREQILPLKQSNLEKIKKIKYKYNNFYGDNQFKLSDKRHIISYSTRRGQHGFDGRGSNSIYTSTLSNLLLEKDNRLGEIFDKLRELVKSRSRNNQCPMVNTEYLGYREFLKTLKKKKKKSRERKLIYKEVDEIPNHIHDNWK